MQKQVNEMMFLNFWNLIETAIFRAIFDYIRGKIRGGAWKEKCILMLGIQLLFCTISKFACEFWKEFSSKFGLCNGLSSIQTWTAAARSYLLPKPPEPFHGQIQSLHAANCSRASSKHASRRRSSDGVGWIQTKAAMAVVIIHRQFIPSLTPLLVLAKIRRAHPVMVQFLAHASPSTLPRSIA